MAESKGESKGTTKPPVFSFGYLHIDDRLLAGPNCLLWNLRYISFIFVLPFVLRQTFVFPSFVPSISKDQEKIVLIKRSSHPNLLTCFKPSQSYRISFLSFTNQEARWPYRTD